MALLVEIVCSDCGKSSLECVASGMRPPYLCSDCYTKKKNLERAKHLLGLSMLTIEERLELIEKWIYDYKPPVSINDIRF